MEYTDQTITMLWKNTQSKNISFNLNGSFIKTEDEGRKSSRQLEFKKNGKLFKYIRQIIYVSLLSYQTLTAAQQFGIFVLKLIQERTLKCICNENHSTYEELLAKSNLP